MPKTNVERDKIYEIAKTIATHVYNKKCGKEGCTKCPNNGDCTPMEMAYVIVGAGYELAANDHNAIRFVHHEQTEELAKTIASSRGYGCNYNDSCAKCSCRIVECVPLTIAELLLKAGYEKKAEVK
jgi:hypothetical protein